MDTLQIIQVLRDSTNQITGIGWIVPTWGWWILVIYLIIFMNGLLAWSWRNYWK